MIKKFRSIFIFSEVEEESGTKFLCHLSSIQESFLIERQVLFVD
jgi:hypothetical protein